MTVEFGEVKTLLEMLAGREKLAFSLARGNSWCRLGNYGRQSRKAFVLNRAHEALLYLNSQLHGRERTGTHSACVVDSLTH